MKRFSLVLCILISFFWSCSPYKQLGEGEYLLNKNIIRCNRPELKDGIKVILKQKTNRRILFFLRPHLAAYTLGNKGKPNKFKNWLKYTVGEEPVILDTTLTSRSAKQIKLFMNDNGYFNSEVKDTTFLKKKKAVVKYTIKSNKPYTVLSIVRNVEDSVIREIIYNDTLSSLIKTGQIYNGTKLENERDRLILLLKNNGYYYFNSSYISFLLDTSYKSNQLKILMTVSDIKQYDESGKNIIYTAQHKKWFIDNLFITTDYDPILKTKFPVTDTVIYKGYNFLSTSSIHNIKPETITLHTLLKKDELYSQTYVDKTYRRLSDLGLYKFVNIYFQPDTNGTENHSSLNCFINLSPYQKQDYKFEFEGTNNGGNLGVAGDVSYRNKNIFHGGELFETHVRIALESQKNFSGSEENTKLLLFNTYEAGIEQTIRFPRALWPFRGSFKSKNANPLTALTGSYNIQSRPEFKRNIFDFSYSLEFKRTQFAKIIYTPVEVNFVNVTLDPVFETNLLRLQDPILLSSYQNHLIEDGKISYIFNNQDLQKHKNFFLIRANIETAGNILRIIQKSTNGIKTENGTYEILNKRFAQYLRPDADLRYYQVFSNHSTMVYRLSGGIGMTYLNSVSMPFEKNFYAGGSNDLRAFSSRSLGPGSDTTSYSFERIGDIKINANIEYRYDILRILKGAFFIDAGNIWLRKFDANRIGADFNSSRFLSEVAIGSGIGFRFDFTFFIFRTDIGIPLRNPSYPKNERWFFNKLALRDLQLNLGIGYPF